MAKTKIEWADKVWNPVTGCTKISEGCQNCYAERMHTRLEKIKNSGYCDGEPHFSVRLHPDRLDEPLKWKKPQRVFICSMGDLFHEDVPHDYIDRVIFRIATNKQHPFLILTKRPQRALFHFTKHPYGKNWNFNNLKNLWFGVTVENQQAADERIPILLQIPAVKRFISVEPMLGSTNLLPYLPMVNLVILGGETGPKARPMHPDWARSVRDQCQASGVPFFFKQWGEWLKLHPDKKDDYFYRTNCKSSPDSDGLDYIRVGKKAAGHLLDGKEYREWPE